MLELDDRERAIAEADDHLWRFLGQRIRCLTGRVAVLMDPPEDCDSVLLPDPIREKLRSLGELGGHEMGTVVSSGIPDVCPGDRVAVRPSEGLQVSESAGDRYDWLPDGRDIRFYKGAVDEQLLFALACPI